MQFFKREVIQSLFYEQLAEFIEERLSEFSPRAHVLPIPDHDEYEVDYQLDAGPRPIYLFGVKDNDKARLATISCSGIPAPAAGFQERDGPPGFRSADQEGPDPHYERGRQAVSVAG